MRYNLCFTGILSSIIFAELFLHMSAIGILLSGSGSNDEYQDENVTSYSVVVAAAVLTTITSYILFWTAYSINYMMSIRRFHQYENVEVNKFLTCVLFVVINLIIIAALYLIVDSTLSFDALVIYFKNYRNVAIYLVSCTIVVAAVSVLTALGILVRRYCTK